MLKGGFLASSSLVMRIRQGAVLKTKQSKASPPTTVSLPSAQFLSPLKAYEKVTGDFQGLSSSFP